MRQGIRRENIKLIILVACFCTGIFLANGCNKTRETTDKVVDEVTGYRAFEQGQKLKKEIRQVNKMTQERAANMQNMLKDLNDNN